MAGGVDLLRLLEPVVRPDGLSGSALAPKPPIESRDFESILDEAKMQTQSQQAMQDSGNAEAMKKVDPLQSLARVDLIENPTLLKLFGNAAADSNRSA